MIFHEEVAFRHSRELPDNPEDSSFEVPNSLYSEEQREEGDESSIPDAPIEPKIPTMNFL